MKKKQKLKNDKEVHKNSRIKTPLYKENTHKLTSNFSILTMAARRKWGSIFKMLREQVNIKLCSHSV